MLGPDLDFRLWASGWHRGTLVPSAKVAVPRAFGLSTSTLTAVRAPFPCDQDSPIFKASLVYPRESHLKWKQPLWARS